MNLTKILSAAAAALLCFAQPVWSAFDPVNDDTDIFLANPQFAPSRPNVLIFIDNTANWGQKQGGVTKYSGVTAALRSVLTSTVNDSYNVGMSLFVETGSPNNNTDGAYIRYGIRRMSGDPTDTTSNRGRLISMIGALDENGDKGNNATYSLAMSEMFKYFAGLPTYAGHGKTKADAGETVFVTGTTRQSQPGSPLPLSVLPTANGGNETAFSYTSPIADGCQKNFIIFISNGEAGDNSSSLTTAIDLYTADIGSAPGTIAITPNAEQGIITDEYSKYMAAGDCNNNIDGVQNVFTYTIDILPGHTGHGPDHTALLKSMAQNGKGKYFAVTDISDTKQIETALNTIFQEVQAVNSVFASTTLPVSVNVRGTNLNQVYIGVFRPDPNKAPRWLGNLKLYKLAVNSSTNQLFLADSTGAEAEDPHTGFIGSSARSYWTTPGTYWQYRDLAANGEVTPLPALTSPGCPTSSGNCSDSPDGNLVEKGGAAQRLRVAYPTDQSSRPVYTCYKTTTSGGTTTGGLCTNYDLTASSNAFIGSNILETDVGAFPSVAVTAMSAVGDGTAQSSAFIPTPTSTATVTVTTQTDHGLQVNDPVRIEGVTPDIFNSSYYRSQSGNSSFEFIVKSVADTTHFTYTLPSVPSATTARVTAVGHNLLTSDLVVIDTTPDEYDTVAAGGAITRISADLFDYSVNSPGAVETGPRTVQKGRKQVTSLSGVNFTATAVVPSHGYGLIGATVNSPGVTITGASPTLFNLTPSSITITGLDTFTYTTGSFISAATGGTATSVVATVTMPSGAASSQGHRFPTSSSIRIRGTTVAGYNGNSYSVTNTGATTFTFTPGGTPTAADGGYAGVLLATIAYPYTGGGADTAEVTITGSHGFLAGDKLLIVGTQGNFVAGNVTCPGHDGTFTVRGGTGDTTVTSGGNTYSIVPTSTKFWITGNKTRCPTFTAASPATAIAGFALAASNGIAPNVAATGSIYSEKNISISAITLLSNPTGASITAGNPSAPASALRDQIVNWVRGQDNVDNENLDCTNSPYWPCDALTAVGTTPRLTDIRASVHGDVLHSRPAVVNYNRIPTESNAAVRDSDIYVYYGSNDGLLRAVKGGTNVATTGPDASVTPGLERWSFIPLEFFSKMKRLRDQLPPISSSAQKDYFFDGSIGVYYKDAKGSGSVASPSTCNPALAACTSAGATVSGVIGDNTHAVYGDKVILYLSMRRGGRMIYALDVTNPASPQLLWRKVQGASDSTGWGELGQTWSEPKVVKLAASLGNANNPENVALIFGAGYERATDDIYPCLLSQVTTTAVEKKAVGNGSVTFTSTGTCTITGATGSASSTSRSRGRGIFVVDAISGDVVWQAGAGVTTASTAGARKLNVPTMTCGLPSDVTVLDKNRDGLADRIYVGDVCGQVWRTDISKSDMNEWTVTKIASVWTGAATDITGKRKFLFPPDLVFGTDASNNYTAVLLGSGDREHPFDAVVVDRFYMIKDRDSSDPGNPQAGATNSSSVKISGFGTAPTGAVVSDASLFDATNTALIDSADPQGLLGWKITLRAGEKVVSNATSVAGTTFFNTNQPSAVSSGTCGSNLGIAREYAVGFADAAATIDLNAAGGITIADRSIVHAGGGYLPSPVAVVVEIDGKKYQAVISGTSVQTPPGLSLDKRTRVYWYKEVE